MVQLKNWRTVIVSEEWDGYTAPELLRKMMGGQVYGHPKFPDGAEVITGTIRKIDWEKRTFSTSRTDYELVGPPDPEFRDWVEKNYPQLLKNIEG